MAHRMKGVKASSRAASLLLVLALAAGCVGSGLSEQDRDAKREMEAVLRAQESAWNRGDVEGFLNAGYLRSPTLTFFSGGEVIRGFDTVLEHFRKSYTTGGREMGHLTFAELETLVAGPDEGIVRGRWRLDLHGEKKAGGLFTLVMLRMPEGWRIVHDHTSVDDKPDEKTSATKSD